MPQLDQFTYLTQFVWLTLSFLVYYVLVYNYSLPKISRILKLRARYAGSESTGSEKEIDSRSPILVDSIKQSAAYLNTSVTSASEWCHAHVNLLNGPVNQVYVRSLAEMIVSRTIKFSVVKRLAASPKTQAISTVSNSLFFTHIRSCMVS